MSNFSFVPKEEVSAVWAITAERVRGAVVEVGVGKSVRFTRRWDRPRGKDEKISWELIDNLRHIPVIVSLDSTLAYTSIVPFVINLQGKAREDRLEFQSVVREIVNRANLETRLLAARALGVEDLDAVLFDARVTSLKIDGKEVAGWPQMAGKKLTGEVNLMFTSRPIFEELHNLRHSRKELYITEENKAALVLLGRHYKNPLRLLHADPGRAEFLIMDEKHEPVFRKNTFNWSSPLTLLMEEWNLSEAAAREILDLNKTNQVSKNVARLLEKIIASSAENLDKALAKTKFRGNMYVRGTDVLPFDLPHAQQGLELKTYPFAEIWAALGFEGEVEETPENLAMLLPLLEYYYHRGDPAHHHALTRQIHWIAE